MTLQKKEILNQILRVFLGECFCIAVMLGVYGLTGNLLADVWLGALVGGLVAIGNFVALSLSVSRAADLAQQSQEPVKAKLMIQRNSTLRLLALLVIYILLLRSAVFDPLASVLPLLFVQISIYLTNFFRREKKDGENIQ